MGVAVLNPQDCLNHYPHMKFPRNPSASPNRPKKPVSNNRTRRSPPRNKASRSPSPDASPSKKSLNNTVVPSQVRILKRGEDIPKKTSDLVVEKPDLVSIVPIGPDPVMIPSQIRLSGRKSKLPPFYAGPVTMTSPPPSDVPLPAFTMKATKDLIRMLRLDIA